MGAIKHEVELDMEQINRELSVVHESNIKPRAVIDDVKGMILLPPNTMGDRIHLHLSFLRDEIIANEDLIYVEDLTDHVVDKYGKLMLNLKKEFSKIERLGLRTKTHFVGYHHPLVRRLKSSGYGVRYEQCVDTVVVSIGKRFVEVKLS